MVGVLVYFLLTRCIFLKTTDPFSPSYVIHSRVEVFCCPTYNTLFKTDASRLHNWSVQHSWLLEWIHKIPLCDRTWCTRKLCARIEVTCVIVAHRGAGAVVVNSCGVCSSAVSRRVVIDRQFRAGACRDSTGINQKCVKNQKSKSK